MASNAIHNEIKNDKEKPVFQELNADQEPEITEIESLCLHCGKNGITKLLLTKIPFYKEVVIMSFSCNHCHWENNELQPASKIQEKGVSYILKVQNCKDLARVVVKTEWACIMIPEIEFEIPTQSQEGIVTTVEGVIERAYTGIAYRLDKEKESESSLKISEFLGKLSEFRTGNSPFTFVLRDCSGNSFLENICAPASDPQLEIKPFERTREECLMLGLYHENNETENGVENQKPEEKSGFTDEVLGFPTNCYSCNAPCITNMKLTQIPHFKDVVIMATTCDACGHKTNEVKSASGIEPLGLKITLCIENAQDLKRDVLKSDTCSISIKELELEVGPAAFSSRYTTVEGILITIKEQLKESNPFIAGDSADPLIKENMNNFFQNIDEIISSRKKATLILDDPCGNSYLQSNHYPNLDTNLTMEKYERSVEQNEELGLLDMKVENYEESQLCRLIRGEINFQVISSLEYFFYCNKFYLLSPCHFKYIFQFYYQRLIALHISRTPQELFPNLLLEQELDTLLLSPICTDFILLSHLDDLFVSKRRRPWSMLCFFAPERTILELLLNLCLFNSVSVLSNVQLLLFSL